MTEIPDIFDTWGNLARLQGLVGHVGPAGFITDDGAGNVTLSGLFLTSPLTGSYIAITDGVYTLSTWQSLVVKIPPTSTMEGTITPEVISWSVNRRKFDHRDYVVFGQRTFTGRVAWRFPDFQDAATLSPNTVVKPLTRLQHDNTQQTSTGNTPVSVTWANELLDTDAMFAAGTPTRMTCKTAGKYDGMFLGELTGSADFQVRWLLNGTTEIARWFQILLSSTKRHTVVLPLKNYPLAINDYLEVQIIGNNCVLEWAPAATVGLSFVSP